MSDSVLQSELRRRMVEHGFNQKSLARAADLNETAVRDILKGRSLNPRIDTLGALAGVLGCTLNDLVGDSRLKDEIHRLRSKISELEDGLARLKNLADSWES